MAQTGIKPIEPREKFCVHHTSSLVFYCESCEEPICQNCTILGPHNNQLHRINTLQDAYKARVIAIDQLIEKSLLSKRDKLLAQIHRIDYRMEEVKAVKTVIERDVR
jgi:palmitoyltransferase